MVTLNTRQKLIAGTVYQIIQGNQPVMLVSSTAVTNALDAAEISYKPVGGLVVVKEGEDALAAFALVIDSVLNGFSQGLDALVEGTRQQTLGTIAQTRAQVAVQDANLAQEATDLEAIAPPP